MTTLPPDRRALLGADGAAALAEFRAAMGKRAAPATTPPPAALEEALAQAALRGDFDIHDLAAFAPDLERAGVLTALAARCEASETDGRRLHRLNADAREATLGRLLADRPALDARLRALRLPAADGPGRELRRLLRGETPTLRRLSNARLADLLIAAGWLAPFGRPVDPRAVRHEMARRGLDDWADALLAEGFFGRDDALARIRAFVASGPGTLIVQGVGGVGKSTLLARHVRDARDVRAVLHFDFDRPALDPAAMGLTLELTRQLARVLPAEAAALGVLRDRLRVDFGQGETIEAAFRGEAAAAAALRDIVGRAGLASARTLVILDSFEAVMGRGPAMVARVRDWTHFARREIGLDGLRVLVAGRAAGEAQAAFDGADVLTLGDIEPQDAHALLVRKGLNAQAAAIVVGAFGGNPLLLRLAGRFLIEHPEIPAAALIEDGATPQADAALAQGGLYRRILAHVGTGPDDPLRRLAYPGLALRRVTPGLVRGVIAPALGMAPLDDTAARALFERLVAQVWLVRPLGPGLAEHRRDLRQVMARLIGRDAAAREQVADLHARAVAWHDRADDPDMPADAAAAEALYHRLMILGPGEDIPPAARILVGRAVGADLDDLPARARAVAKFHMWPSGPRITPDEAKLLPDAHLDLWSLREAWSALDDDRPEAALALAAALRDAGRLTVPPVWELTAIHDCAAWDELSVAARLDAAASALSDGRYEDADRRDPSYGPREDTEPAATAIALLGFQRGDPDPLARLPQRRRPLSEAVARLNVYGGDLDALSLLPRGQGLGTVTGPENLRRLRPESATAVLRLATLAAMADPAVLDDLDLEGLAGLAADPIARNTLSSEALDSILRLIALDWAARGPQTAQPAPLTPAGLRPTPDFAGRVAGAFTAGPRPQYAATLAASLLPVGEIDEPGWAARTLGFDLATQTSGALLGFCADKLLTALGHPAVHPMALAAAGIRPGDIAAGLHPELRRVARHALRMAFTTDAALAAFADRVPHVAGATPPDEAPFLPTDLTAASWLAAARDEPRRAFSTLVEWTARTRTLRALLAAAEATADGDRARLARVGAMLARWDAAFESRGA